MKSAIIKYILFTLSLFLGAIGLAQTGMFTAFEALTLVLCGIGISNGFKLGFVEPK